MRLLEAHDSLGGRARSNDGPFKANLGPHALYQDGPLWQWLAERNLLPAHVGPPLGGASGARFRWEGAVRRTPPLGAIPSVLRLRGRKAPVELDFRSWAAGHTDERTAELLSAAAGVYTFYHDPGELSAAFVWTQTVRLFLARPPGPARYACGGWGMLVALLERRVRELGVTVETGRRVDELPTGPVIVATELEQAAQLLGEESLSWPSGRTVCLDLGLRSRRGDPWIVSDMEQAGWIGRYSTSDRTIAPAGHDLIQAQMPIRPGESVDQAGAAAGGAARCLAGGLARARDLAPASGDGRALGRPGHARQDLARPPCGGPRRRRVPGRRHGRGPWPARRGLPDQCRRGQPAGAGGGERSQATPAQGCLDWNRARITIVTRS